MIMTTWVALQTTAVAMQDGSAIGSSLRSWVLNYIKLLHQSLSKHPVGFPTQMYTWPGWEEVQHVQTSVGALRSP